MERNVRSWPFASTSIWNMPIGSGANYVPAELYIPNRFTTDEDILILRPDAPLTDIYYTDIAWGDAARVYGSRCERKGDLLSSVPIPPDFVFFPPKGEIPNAALTALMPDGRTLVQGSPFSRCYANGYGTMRYANLKEMRDIYGDGMEGAHGGSGLAGMGGTIRMGELLPGSVIRHVLKINVWAAKDLSYNQDDTPGYRWPAKRADSYAQEGYGGSNPAVEMGALVALKPDFDETALATEPSKILARAFKDYGAYIVNDTHWDASAVVIEVGPAGDVRDEFFDAYGYALRVANSTSPWYQDLKTIFTNLHVVDNNSESNIGGGGIPRQPMAPEIQPIG